MKDAMLDGAWVGGCWVFRVNKRVIAKTYSAYASQLIWDGLMQKRLSFNARYEVEKIRG